MEVNIKSMEIEVGSLATWDEAISHAGSYLMGDPRFPNLEEVSFKFNGTKYSITKIEA